MKRCPERLSPFQSPLCFLFFLLSSGKEEEKETEKDSYFFFILDHATIHQLNYWYDLLPSSFRFYSFLSSIPTFSLSVYFTWFFRSNSHISYSVFKWPDQFRLKDTSTKGSQWKRGKKAMILSSFLLAFLLKYSNFYFFCQLPNSFLSSFPQWPFAPFGNNLLQKVNQRTILFPHWLMWRKKKKWVESCLIQTLSFCSRTTRYPDINKW